jgi:hypothetical protein
MKQMLLQMTSGFCNLGQLYSRLKLQKTTCHLQQHFFNIFEPNKGTKGPENHSLD